VALGQVSGPVGLVTNSVLVVHGVYNGVENTAAAVQDFREGDWWGLAGHLGLAAVDFGLTYVGAKGVGREAEAWLNAKFPVAKGVATPETGRGLIGLVKA
jgi:hypothetical protein